MYRVERGFVALVTGGASGLGEAVAQNMTEKGATVFAIDLPDAIRHATANKQADPDSNVHFREADITNEEQVISVIEEIRAKFNRLDCVVNCAGIFGMHAAFDISNNQPHSMEDFTKYYKINVFGTFNVIRLAVSLLRETQAREVKEGGGVIVTVSSVQHRDGPAENVAYASSKAAVSGMTVPLARELAAFGIRVVDIAPGCMLTPMLMRGGDNIVKNVSKITMFPLRPGKPEEFAELVRFIIENPYINGTTVYLDAGARNPSGTTFSLKED